MSVTKELTCICCPLGCQISVEMEGNEILSVFPGLADPFFKKRGIDFFRRIKAPDPAPDLRIWRISRRLTVSLYREIREIQT